MAGRGRGARLRAVVASPRVFDERGRTIRFNGGKIRGHDELSERP